MAQVDLRVINVSRDCSLECMQMAEKKWYSESCKRSYVSQRNYSMFFVPDGSTGSVLAKIDIFNIILFIAYCDAS